MVDLVPRMQAAGTAGGPPAAAEHMLEPNVLGERAEIGAAMRPVTPSRCLVSMTPNTPLLRLVA